ncbi:Leukemia inhibitory factor receptor [Cricetulus griseus]|uniref:Leukemia inhibitory factor receptor n=1 Tax=Cricetulus griseus TaxID=10029 RepID=G3HGV0_CRIGR|nr:Leukemia inhibitory factor receptor [Cricetulus griseus]
MLPGQEIHNFTLTGRNPLGHAESAIFINITERDDILVEQAVGMGKRIFLSWHPDPNMTCDYVIKWCNSSRSEPCLMDWIKVPSNSTETIIESGHSDIKLKNITDISQKTLRIADLQGKTSYHLVLRAYTHGGLGPEKSMFVVTKENSVGLIIAILIPVAVAVIVGVVTSILCYRKREWIKETFYPDIPNPENCKALQFQKSICEGSSALKTLEMNPCTPNNVEVLESRSIVPKIEDTEIISPVAERPGECSEADPENHVVVSYCPPIIEEEISNPAADEAGGTSQVVYIDVQSMYQPQAKPEEEQGIDPGVVAGYKPQMRLPINSAVEDTTAEDEADKTAGYRPQANVNTWNLVSPDSPRSTDSNSEIVSFGSPCSINSRQFLIPPKDEDSPKSNGGGWSFTNFFQNKPND